jgi:hypothetical protein
VRFVARRDGFVSATEMCRGVGMQWGDFHRTARCACAITRVLKAERLAEEAQVVRKENAGMDDPETWIHPHLSIYLAVWCDPGAEGAVVDTVVRLMKGEVTTEESQTLARDIRECMRQVDGDIAAADVPAPSPSPTPASELVLVSTPEPQIARKRLTEKERRAHLSPIGHLIPQYFPPELLMLEGAYIGLLGIETAHGTVRYVLKFGEAAVLAARFDSHTSSAPSWIPLWIAVTKGTAWTRNSMEKKIKEAVDVVSKLHEGVSVTNLNTKSEEWWLPERALCDMVRDIVARASAKLGPGVVICSRVDETFEGQRALPEHAQVDSEGARVPDHVTQAFRTAASASPNKFTNTTPRHEVLVACEETKQERQATERARMNFIQNLLEKGLSMEDVQCAVAMSQTAPE